MIAEQKLGKLFAGLRATVTIADEQGRIIFLNDLALEHYGDRGGKDLIGTSLHKCHNPESQAKIRETYARYRAGEFTPTRYHSDKEGGLAESIVLIPLLADGRFSGVAELMWHERSELVFES